MKWDGIRALIYLNEGQLKIYSRNGNDITEQFPELNVPEEAFRINNAIFDSEIVCVDSEGRANFKKVIKRLMSKKNFDYESKRTPAYCYLFDCLYLDGRSLTNDPQERRRWWTIDSVRIGETNYRISQTEGDGKALFAATKAHGIEGIVAKRTDAKYTPGKRSDAWIKVKVKETMDCFIIGFMRGEGERERFFGSLQLAEKQGEELVYRGRVGTGFDDALLKSLTKQFMDMISSNKPVAGEVHEEKKTVWLEPELICEVEYSMITGNGTFRDPVFKKLVTDL